MPYQGEEGVYTITSLEMWFRHEWIKPFFYGENYGRPPLFNWLIIPLASFLGWEHVLVAARLIAAAATFGTGLILFWLMRQLFQDKNLAWFAGAIYLSGDLLFRRGWLAYADPLFALFVFGAIAFLWVAVDKKRLSLFALANLCLMASFLTKALTAYCFYGIAFLVLFWLHQNRRFLFSPLSIIFQLTALLFPLIWNMVFSDGAHSQEMVADVLSKLSGSELKNYFIKVISYPFYALFHWMPASGLVLYFFWQSKKQNNNLFTQLKQQEQSFVILKIAFWILFLNFIPYWFAPQNRIRYILPLYPFFALIASYILYQVGEKAIKLTTIILGVMLVVKLFFGIYGYTLIERKVRGDYTTIAQDVIQKTQGHPLYIEDDTATGLSVTAQIDVLRLPEAPLTRCKDRHGNIVRKEGFYLVNDLKGYEKSQVFHQYSLGRHKLYLLCNGKACHKKIR